MSEPHLSLLEVDDLTLEFRTRSGTVRALEHVSFKLDKGETIAIVGESGSGKSVLAYAIMGIQDPAARIVNGQAWFGGLDVLTATESDLEKIRGREMSMIFQNPRVALNPIRRVGRQLEDVLRKHSTVLREHVQQRAVELLAQVRIPDPERRYSAYPFELSGGICQRVMIALALACTPSLLIADEPTTGLDVTTQATIMDLVTELAARNNMATILITHDLGVAAEYCDRIVVMHAGHVVEDAPAEKLFRTPHHPYTAQLIAATPTERVSLGELSAIPGNLPDLRRPDLPVCRFSARCDRHIGDCDLAPLPVATFERGHRVACRRPL